MKNKRLQIAVVGSAGADDYPVVGGASIDLESLAEEAGYLLAQRNIIVVTGGKSGIMEAAARGAKKAGGMTVGVVKGKDRFTSNEFTDIEVISGMEAVGFDEVLLTFMSDGCIVLGGGAGTLQEIALMYRNDKPIVVLDKTGGWAQKTAALEFLDERSTRKILIASSIKEAVDLIIQNK